MPQAVLWSHDAETVIFPIQDRLTEAAAAWSLQLFSALLHDIRVVSLSSDSPERGAVLPRIIALHCRTVCEFPFTHTSWNLALSERVTDAVGVHLASPDRLTVYNQVSCSISLDVVEPVFGGGHTGIITNCFSNSKGGNSPLWDRSSSRVRVYSISSFFSRSSKVSLLRRLEDHCQRRRQGGRIKIKAFQRGMWLGIKKIKQLMPLLNFHFGHPVV